MLHRMITSAAFFYYAFFGVPDGGGSFALR